VLFVSSNGVGLGHLTRLLSIARRMPGDHEPVFLTLSQALPIVRQCGYHAEYLPFHAAAGCDPNHWNPWFAEQLGQVLDYHRAETVVFDGGMPYQGLIDALARRPRTRMVWVRRGMWKETQNNEASIRRQHFFDLIVEPTDIAEAADLGATAAYRAFARKVAPIRFLDDDELLPRAEAAARLGLDPTRPACLIQLGSGSNRDIVSMIDTVLDRLGRVPGMQPVIAEWLISPNQLDLWPGVPRLRGFPLSLYFRGFDFTVSAAGYNSFNEIISFGLPAVFMANDHAMMDDQAGRARFAQDNDAAFHLPEHRPDAIGPMIEALMDPRIRERIVINCERIALGNGAADAAALIAALG
jgi:UDP:flavonoid glycosyltransferase YjiC (YdhE family)